MKTKFIFITGGVVSSLGKGITTASIGMLMKAHNYKVDVLKFDPYLNVDPGTMSPYQHGEVFVTDDGAETDLDLGHYERYLNQNMSRKNNVTQGQIYERVLHKERYGEYLGKTVQVVPHVTNEIKSCVYRLARRKDIVITEVGGTVGDIESLPFLEAIRQIRLEVGKENVLYIHITLLPYIKAAEEIKTKPTQHSVMKLREIGIEPDIIICRTEKLVGKDIKEKISLFCNVEEDSVILEPDVGSCVYKVPIMLKEQNLDKIILRKLKLKHRRCDIEEWSKLVEKYESLKEVISIAVAGKYTQLKDAYKSILEALFHAGLHNDVKVDIKYVDVEQKNFEECLKDVKGLIVPGGFGERGVEGKIQAVRFARENKIPFLGICLGMQCAVIEFARNVCGLKDANSTEFNPKTEHPVVDLMESQKMVEYKGGTMRLGAYLCKIKKDTLAYKVYQTTKIYERHRHRYEVNNKYVSILQKNGLIVSGHHPVGNLVEIVEIKDHPYFIAVQFHPEFKSRFTSPHPLFYNLVKVVKEIC
ncbi:MAG: CTP synthase [Elusimicrobiota bacterium]|nr:CTP synthase [Endomicrobiia bacterium]MDW8166568.1 CTP synthase [Elusimicrobiota bacterium]